MRREGQRQVRGEGGGAATGKRGGGRGGAATGKRGGGGAVIGKRGGGRGGAATGKRGGGEEGQRQVRGEGEGE